MISPFPEVDESMAKPHKMVKHFSSAISNRKKHDDILDKHRYSPRNELKQDHNGARIVAAFGLLKSALRIKTGTQACCKGFKIPMF